MKRRAGQASTETMMLTSVGVIAVVAASYAFVPTFRTGVHELSYDVSRILSNFGSERGGFGVAASGAAGNGGSLTSGQRDRAERNPAANTGDFDPAAGNGI